MTRMPGDGPAPSGASSVETLVVPRTVDLGGFDVRRVLPSAQRRSVGPFVFVDSFGPATFEPAKGLDVRPHPHIGLATITYLLDGTILHRDSLGSVQPIHPGDVNWMTAGRGIVHSERTPDELRPAGTSLYGVQTWVALPASDEEVEPSFVHHPASQLPHVSDRGVSLRLIVGGLYGARSPVRTFADTLYADITLDAGSPIAIPADHEERALYALSGAIEVDGIRFAPHRLIVLKPGAAIDLRAIGLTRLLLIGGEALDGPRVVWWNFVARTRERIEQAKADWTDGRFGGVPGDTEFIPLPPG